MIVFRADASAKIGSGHISRCLVLAETLRRSGQTCHFICRQLQGDQINKIQDKGFDVSLLSAHEQSDAKESAEIISRLNAELVVVDHYDLGVEWEKFVALFSTAMIMVIDDLVDREHNCDLFLNQNHKADAVVYSKLLPPKCKMLLGTEFALLREEFSGLRQLALQRRQNAVLKEILISLGGGDCTEITEKVMAVMSEQHFDRLRKVTVVSRSITAESMPVSLLRDKLGVSVECIVDADSMSELMTRADLSIGAAGTTSWERCCLGLPTVLLTLADNQIAIARALEEEGAALLAGDLRLNDWQKGLSGALDMAQSSNKLEAISVAAAALCDGQGAWRVAKEILRPIEKV